MQRETLRKEIEGLPVFDTHTHLIGGSLQAEDFWKIGHYFWFLRELEAAGYPEDAEDLNEMDRMQAYAQAFQKTKNTSMNWVVRRIFNDLYNLELDGVDSLKQAGTMVRDTARDPSWPRQVAKRIGVKKIVVNRDDDADFKVLPRRAVLVPRIDSKIRAWVENIHKAGNRQDAAREVEDEVASCLRDVGKRGCPGIMTTLPRFHASTYCRKDSITSDDGRDAIIVYVLHLVCREAEENGLFVQFFLGMESIWSSIATSVNDPERVVRLHGLFEMYECQFEIVLASEINNMDAVQAARIFRNVFVGGLWWFNFRSSTYRECMQRRIEALPPSKSSIMVSDARCIEWCYGKILLVKRLLADFLYGQIQEGWLDEDEALRVAREWLYNSAEDRY